MSHPRPIAFVALIVTLTHGLTLQAQPNNPPTDFPVDTPESQGVDSAKLAAMCVALNRGSADIRALLIIRNGKLIFERYEQGLSGEENFYAYSVTKSFNSTLVGIAIDKKLMQLNQPVFDAFFKDVTLEQPPDARKRRMTVRHLLMMSSGLNWTDNQASSLDAGTDFARMQSSRNRALYVLNRPMAAEPGTVFKYSNGDAQLLAAIVGRASKMPVVDFAKEHLFDKLDFKNWEWVGRDRTGLPPGGTALRLRPRDMAKLGQLFLQNGRWGDQQIVSPQWVAAASRDQTRSGYGYQWWTNIDAAGHSSYSAIGLKGQYVRVIPDLKLVISMNSVQPYDTKNQLFNQLVNQQIVPAVRSPARPLPPNQAATASLDTALKAANQVKRPPAANAERVDRPHPPRPGAQQAEPDDDEE